MIAKFRPYLKAHRWQVAWALAQVFLVAGFELLKPWPLQIGIDYLLAGMLVVLLPMDPVLTLLALTVVPALFVLIAVFNRKIVDVATEVRDLDSRVYSLVQWGMSAIKVVQAFTKEEEEHRRFMGAS